jgi:hypothetical protein
MDRSGQDGTGRGQYVMAVDYGKGSFTEGAVVKGEGRSALRGVDHRGRAGFCSS